VYYLLTIDIDLSALERELKKRAAELLLLSVLEARPRHGYELGKLIETQSCCSIASKSAAGSRGRGSRRRASAGAASIGGAVTFVLLIVCVPVQYGAAPAIGRRMGQPCQRATASRRSHRGTCSVSKGIRTGAGAIAP
jgi:hypothetical protein